ncbi:MAG: ester cyclase [Nostoc sp. ChiSLP02]|nr:ester cyclase [Nostoc sp. DedSLP05]MDZ8103235.1 ester cyclase [Nostoc sp. DedSLP01]MDZ8188014.1 ester cyclase [Nostoc sp. ChiSLP02]
MTTSQTIEKFIELLWNQRQLNLADELFSDDFIARPFAHQPIWNGTGPESMKHHIQEWLEGVPDLHMKALNILVQGNQSFVRWEMTGTHKGVLYGIPSTGKTIKALGITFFEVKDGKIRELQTLFDALGLMQQLDIVPNVGILIQNYLKQLES